MSRINVENIRHPDAASDSLQLSDTGNITAPGNLSVTGTSTLTDDLIVDTDTLFVDVSTDRVGINTASPTAPLQVNGTGQIARFESDSSSVLVRLANTGTNPCEFIYTNELAINVDGSERARIDGSGRLLVGLNTGANRNLLQIQGDVDNGATGVGGISLRRGLALGSIGNGSTLGQLDFCMSDGGVGARIIGEAEGAAGTNDYPGRLEFYTTADAASSPTERMRIDSSGRVMIGTTSVNHSGAFLSIDVDASGSQGTAYGTNSTSSRLMISFNNPNGEVGHITTNGSNTSYNTSSDYRLKENVVDLDGAITRIKQLAPKRFNFIADAETTVDGFIAHEAQAVVPEAVTGTHNEVDDENNPVYQGIDQSKLVPLLTAALQEAIGKIETLETANASQAATITAFEARLTALEGGAN